MLGYVRSERPDARLGCGRYARPAKKQAMTGCALMKLRRNGYGLWGRLLPVLGALGFSSLLWSWVWGCASSQPGRPTLPAPEYEDSPAMGNDGGGP